jgi:hypothetical protein
MYLLAPLADWVSGATVFTQPFRAVAQAYYDIHAACTPPATGPTNVCSRVGLILGYPVLPFPPLAILLILLVLGIRWLQHIRDVAYLNPFTQTRAVSASSNLLAALRYSLAAVIVLLIAAAAVDAPSPLQCASTDLNSLGRALANLLRPSDCSKYIVSSWTSIIVVWLGIAAACLVFLFKRTTIRIRAQFFADIGAVDTRSKFKLDLVRLGLFVTGGPLAVSAINMSGQALFGNIFALVPLWLVLVVLTLVLLASLSALFWLLVWHGVLEYFERRRRDGSYRSSSDLLLLPNQNQIAYAREARGSSFRQNHLASLTHLKPGIWNYVWLRLALFAIDLLGRYYFNKGTLGDIPTILSARWVLIDNGRQLLFLDHYAGAWDSYLSEFVDMGAVKGVNAIWSNTFVKVRPEPQADIANFEFPRTNYIFWRGAQDEKPFKAFVRHSQVETLVWYGAYADLDVVAINRATGHRKRLFAKNTMDACDETLRDL